MTVAAKEDLNTAEDDKSVVPPFSLFKSEYDALHNAYWNNDLTESELEDWYENQLRAVLRHVKEKSPFYKEQLKNIEPSAVNLENLSSLPFTTKDDLRESMHDILCEGMDEAIFYYETTGTTGPATPCPRSKNESYASNKQLSVAYQRVIDKHFADEKTVVGILGPTEVHSFGDTIGDVCYQLDVCNAKIWPHSPVIGFNKTLQLMRDLKVGVAASAPGLILGLAKEAEKNGYDPRKDLFVRAFMMSGELCTPALKNNLSSLWNAEPYNSLYGSQEAFIIAASNTSDQLVPHRLNYIIEILDPETGESLGNSGEGELCVTMLIPGTKPLVRYRTGDLVSVHPSGNDAIASKYVMKVVGRVKDQLQLNGRSFTAGDIEQALLEGVERCLGYQIVLNDSSGEDTIIAKLEMSRFFEGNRRDLGVSIQDRLEDRLGVKSTVMIVDDLDEHVNLGSWFSWKEARISDQRIKEKKV